MNYKCVTVLISLTLISFGSCKENKMGDNLVVENDTLFVDSIMVKVIDSAVVSDYNLSDVDSKNVEEFKENLVKIEKKFGEQWGFCTCVVKGDSINKAFMNPDLPDNEFDILSDRFDYIDDKCKAFRIQNPSITPEERSMHEDKVKKCLKEAGL